MDIRKNVNEFQAKPFGRGQAFKCVNKDGRVFNYLISYASNRRVFLSNLETGKSWRVDVAVADATCLSPAEASELFNGLEIIAALKVSTEEIEVEKPSRTYRTGQSFRFKNPYDGSEDVYQIACAEGSKRRLICQAGDRLGMFWGNVVEVKHSEAITQAEFDKMKTNLTLIEEVTGIWLAV